MEELEKYITEGDNTYYERLINLINKEITISEEVLHAPELAGNEGILTSFKTCMCNLRLIYDRLIRQKEHLDAIGKQKACYLQKDVDKFLEGCYEAFKDGDKLKRHELDRWNNIPVAERKRFILSSIARTEHDKRVNYSAYQSAKRRLEDVSQEEFNFSL